MRGLQLVERVMGAQFELAGGDLDGKEHIAADRWAVVPKSFLNAIVAVLAAYGAGLYRGA